MRKKLVISNNSPLVALLTLDLLSLLRELYTEVLIPEEVQNEFLATDQTTRQAALDNSPWITTVSLTVPLNTSDYGGLGAGEAAVFALAEEHNADLVILDDREARQYAQQIKLPMKGTVGILLEAKERGFIETIKPLLNLLLDSGARLAPRIIDSALKLAGEAD